MPVKQDKRRAAGERAEKQQRHYLHRAFAQDDKVRLLHDLRIEDPEQPEPDATPGVCQIDHLVLHRNGAFIVESKSVHDRVSVRGDGHGGDEWTRRVHGSEHGFASPIQQAVRQGEFLRKFLQRHRESLLGKMPLGFRTFGKIVSGTDHRGFRFMPIQIVVAFSDDAKVNRARGWEPKQDPFPTYVCKADQVPELIRKEIALHAKAARHLGDTETGYGVWSMKTEELAAVEAFLASKHTPRVAPTPEPAPRAATPPPAPPPTPAHEPGPLMRAALAETPAPKPAGRPALCPACKSPDLDAKWGGHGYLWACRACDAQTPMPTTCSVCGAVGVRGVPVRIRKQGPKYYRHCDQCGIEERIWTQPASPRE